jgi:hypothetical protein
MKSESKPKRARMMWLKNCRGKRVGLILPPVLGPFVI